MNKNMFRKILLLVFCGMAVVNSLTSAHAANLQEGRDYTVLKTPVKNAPVVVEFFSFYCPPCAAFNNRYFVSQAVEKILPAGKKLEKYHVGTMGPMGKELTDAWSVAKVLGVEDRVELPLFIATQINRSIKTENSIRQVFIEAGISGHDFDAAKNSIAVRALTARQLEAVKTFGVTGTPSFYVNGKYLIHNGAIHPTSEQDYGKSFADVVRTLLNVR